MDKISFSTVEAQCGALSEFIDLLVNRQEGYNISIKPVDDGFDVEFTKEGKFEFLKPEEIKVYPVTLPNNDIVWVENKEEENKIWERWNQFNEPVLYNK
jgi:hypothetical protein